MPIQVNKIRIELDFLWSIKLGAALRVYSFNEPYTHTWHTWSKCGRYMRANGTINPEPNCPSGCPCYLNEPKRYEQKLIIPCAPGQMVIGRPDVNGGSQFWARPIAEVQKNIDSGKLLFNNIPTNWSKLKYEANKEIVNQASDGELMDHLKQYIK